MQNTRNLLHNVNNVVFQGSGDDLIIIIAVEVVTTRQLNTQETRRK